MCGILGGVARAPEELLTRIRPALATLERRGPDDSGEFTLAAGDGAAGVVLGHRRLAIIDLSPGAHQPMVSADGRYVIVINGEIYNYRELRCELEQLGHTFRSQSDTEVLLQALAVWGPACLHRLIGMFAFALVDRSARRLLLARDHFGMKPLYYTRGEGGLVFGSTIASLLPFAPSRRVDAQRLYDYLDSGLTDHGDGTLFADMRALAPAHYAEIDLRRPDVITPVCYWHLPADDPLRLGFADAAHRLRELFLESVTLHLRADVRIGALLSGGTDSSSVVMAMRHVAGANLDIHTFSYAGGPGAINEEPWMDVVNQAAGTIPHKLHLDMADWIRDCDEQFGFQDNPFGSIAVYAQHRLYGLAREAGVRVVLTGQGGDELLAGYSLFWAARAATLLKRGRLLDAVAFARRTAAHRSYGDPQPRNTLLRGVALCPPRHLVQWSYNLLGRPNRAWTRRSWCRRHGVRLRPSTWAGSTGRHTLREVLWHYIRERSLPSLLRYEDRNSMAWSVEARLPFLTPPLAEFVYRLPEEYLIASDGAGKHVFRAAMRGIVPDAILDRKDKVGFSVPMHDWIPHTPGFERFMKQVAGIPAVDPRGVEELLRPSDGRRPDPWRLWHLAALAAWAERFDARFD